MSALKPVEDIQKTQRSVFVGNIPYEATEEQLKEVFEQVGPVASFRIVYDRETGKPKGYGFCEYQDLETAQSAMRNLNDHDFHGRNLRVGHAAGETSNAEKALSQAITGPTEEPLYGNPVEASKAPEAISRAVASLPPEQMFELMKQMKMCIQNNPNEARNMLLQNPQLAYALLQAQIVMKIVDPQVALAMLHRQSEQIPPLMPTATEEVRKSEAAPEPPQTQPAVTINTSQQVPQAAPLQDVDHRRPHGIGGPPVASGAPLLGAQSMAPSSVGLLGQGNAPQPQMSMANTNLPQGGPPSNFGPGVGLGVRGPGPAGGGGLLGDRPGGPGGFDNRNMQGPGPMGPGPQGGAFMDRGNTGGPKGPGMNQGPGFRGPMQNQGLPMGGGIGMGPGSQGGGFGGGPPQGGPAGPGGRPDPRDPRSGRVGPGGPMSGPPRQQVPVAGMQGINPAMMGGPRPGGPGGPAAGGITSQDQEKAQLIMQVLQLSDEQISLLPPDQRQSILILKEQIARSTNP